MSGKFSMYNELKRRSILRKSKLNNERLKNYSVVRNVNNSKNKERKM